MGAIPPLTDQQWAAEFAKYQRTPEYLLVNNGMSVDGFKRIFYVEWAHRLLGRLIGIVFFVPLVYFATRRRLSRPLLRKLTAILILGGLQGALGWFMVKSGLVDVPRVSPYRLTAHLTLAVAIYGYIVWVALDLLSAKGNDMQVPAGFKRLGWLVTALVFVMILAGGFVAGTKAGFVFNTFPLMNGEFVPPGLYALSPWWINWFENVATVQFNHRLLAYVLFAVVLYYWWSARRLTLNGETRIAVHALLFSLIGQIALGITTLLSVVPVTLGALHQAGALVVFTFAIYINHALHGARVDEVNERLRIERFREVKVKP